VVEATDKLSRKQVEESIRNDIVPGQGVFVLTERELKLLCLEQEEKKVIKKYLDPTDIFRYGINYNNKKYLIYSDKNVKRQILKSQKFVHLKKHLDNLCEFITSSNAPYGLHRPREKRFFEEPKIIFKNMFVDNEFAYDEDQYYVGFSFSLIIQRDKNYNLKYVLAILSSKFALDWFYRKGKKRGAGLDIGVMKLRTFPIKELSQKFQEPFVKIVDKALNITKDKDYLENAAKQAKVKELEKQIDQMVYKLYGLTKEEKSIVEEHSKSN
jgi:adenine-specific DNA-methyltransferase